ncbi:MAG TPA: choice-of-anchor J domain-containing protein [Kaistella sp.]|nr:choice-of-anchor J domain-containing protein [Kaistella sp.]
MSSSWYDPAGTSNDWLISPQITLPAAAAFLQWDAKAQDPQYKDGYKVMLAPNGGNTVADFTVQLFSIAAENSTWTTRTTSLAAYAGTMCALRS